MLARALVAELSRPPTQWAGLLLLLAAGLVIALLPLSFATALVLGGVAFLATLVRPQWGLYLLIFAVPFGSLGGMGISAVEVLVAALALSWLGRLALHRGEGPRFPWLSYVLIAYLALLVFSLTVATDLSLSLKEVVKWTEMVVVFLVVANTVEGRGQVGLLVGCLILAGLVEAALGYYQFLGRVGPPSFAIGGRFLRAYGTFGQPNPYAGYLGMVIPLAFGLVIGVRGWPQRRSLLHLWLLGLALLVLLGALAMSFSRGGWLAFGLGLGAMLLARSRRFLLPLVLIALSGLILLLLGTLQLLPAALVGRLAGVTEFFTFIDVRREVPTAQNWAIFERLVNWTVAWEIFRDHPLWGVGLGNFSLFFPYYAPEGWENLTGHAHNYYLNILAEGGAMGLLGYLTVMGAAFAFLIQRLGRAWRRIGVEGPMVTSYALALGALGMLVALSTHNLFDSLYVHGMAAQIGLILALPAARLEG